MERRQHSEEERLWLVAENRRRLKQTQLRNDIDDSNRQAFNKTYRKSFRFIFFWVVRVIYFIFFIVIVAFKDNVNSVENERVIHAHVSSPVEYTKQSEERFAILDLETEHGSYSADVIGRSYPAIKQGDTVQIESNIFGKATYFKEKDWDGKIHLQVKFYLYFIVLFLTFFTFFFNDGIYFLTDRILAATIMANIVAMAAYFLS